MAVNIKTFPYLDAINCLNVLIQAARSSHFIDYIKSMTRFGRSTNFRLQRQHSKIAIFSSRTPLNCKHKKFDINYIKAWNVSIVRQSPSLIWQEIYIRYRVSFVNQKRKQIKEGRLTVYGAIQKRPSTILAAIINE